jgi:hypothetical protein
MGRGGVFKAIVGNCEGKRPFGSFRHGWEDNIEVGLQ